MKLSILVQSVKDGLAAARTNALPASILISSGIILVLLYHYNDSFARNLNTIGELKSRYGFAFSIPSTMIFGAVIPIIFRALFLKKFEAFPVILFYMLFWGFKGVEIDLLYRLQDEFWSGTPALTALIGKVLIDQLIYVPFWTIPFTMLPFQWKENGFSWKRFKTDLNKTGFIRPLIRLTISNWLIWVPAVTIIYAFPEPLQLPLQNITLAIWVLLLVILTEKTKTHDFTDKID